MSVVAWDTVVKLEYTLEVDGVVLDATLAGEPLAVLWGHARYLPPGLEEALEGYPLGEFAVRVPPERGAGPHRPEKVCQVSLADFPPGATVEAGREFRTTDGEGWPVGVRVVSVEGEAVAVDTNPPLAGRALSYTGVIHEVREATDEEIEHGHAHGEGGVEH